MWRREGERRRACEGKATPLDDLEHRRGSANVLPSIQKSLKTTTRRRRGHNGGRRRRRSSLGARGRRRPRRRRTTRGRRSRRQRRHHDGEIHQRRKLLSRVTEEVVRRGEGLQEGLDGWRRSRDDAGADGGAAAAVTAAGDLGGATQRQQEPSEDVGDVLIIEAAPTDILNAGRQRRNEEILQSVEFG